MKSFKSYVNEMDMQNQMQGQMNNNQVVAQNINKLPMKLGENPKKVQAQRDQLAQLLRTDGKMTPQQAAMVVSTNSMMN